VYSILTERALLFDYVIVNLVKTAILE